MAKATQASTEPTLTVPEKTMSLGLLPILTIRLSVKEHLSRTIPRSADDLDVNYSLLASEAAHGGKQGVEKLLAGKLAFFCPDLVNLAAVKPWSSVYTFDSSESPPGAWKWDLMNSLEAKDASRFPRRCIYMRVGFVPKMTMDHQELAPESNSKSVRPAEPVTWDTYPVFDDKFIKTGDEPFAGEEPAKSRRKPRKSAPKRKSSTK